MMSACMPEAWGMWNLVPAGLQIVSRTKLDTMGGCYGFVFDVASPVSWQRSARGIRSHALGSTLLAALQAMDEAYKLYSDLLRRASMTLVACRCRTIRPTVCRSMMSLAGSG